MPGMEAAMIDVILTAEIFIVLQIHFSRRGGKRLIKDNIILSDEKCTDNLQLLSHKNVLWKRPRNSSHIGRSRKEG